jgi:non-canonical purine NTP pyrophosphatase (RdgB/HAM1 family)
MGNITFITGNAAKAQFLSEYFNMPFEHVKINQPEIQSLNLQEVVEDKAKRAFGIIQKPVLVEDVSLILLGLKKLPGPLVKSFIEALGDEGICKLAGQIGDRRAHVEVIFALYDGKEIKTFSGTMDGSIAEAPQGESGFGWDTVFINDGYKVTRALMGKEEWVQTGMRTRALEKMHEYFDNNKN